MEALAVQEGLFVADRKQFKSILGLVQKFDSIRFVHIKREANRAADWVASQFKRSMLCLSNWVDTPPSSLLHMLTRGGLPAPH